jgi:MscS family membrane protein
MMLIILLITLAVSKIVQYSIHRFAERTKHLKEESVLAITLNCLVKPISVAFFAISLYLCKMCLVFENPNATVPVEGISLVIEKGWTQIIQAVAAIAVAYAIYSLVDVIEFYLTRWTSKTKTKLDDMLVPVIRKSIRISIAIISSIYIIDNIFHQNIRSILLGAGVGGIAIALAAKDTIANFFGSITIFADKPFQIDELVKINDYYGPVEEVGFRSTKIRTLEGHLVTIPNSIVANANIENVGQRPFIRRTSNITITYDSGTDKTQKALEIIKDVVASVEEINHDPDRAPRVYFNDFNDCSLNIYMSYWVVPADYWVYMEVNEKVNFEIMKRFEAEKIEFAFPTQTLYLKQDEK